MPRTFRRPGRVLDCRTYGWMTAQRFMTDLAQDLLCFAWAERALTLRAWSERYEKLRPRLACSRFDCKRARELYACDLLLVRPDLHVAWRGNSLPPDATELAAIATGHRASDIGMRS